MAHGDILEYGFKVFMRIYLTHLVNLGHIGELIAAITLTPGIFGQLVEKFWTILLEKLTVRIVVFKGNTVLLHNVVVCKLG
jgi:hypothetical protein